MTRPSPRKHFETSPLIIRLAVMLYVRFPLSLRNVEDLLHERGVDVSHETARFWWHRFCPMFAAQIRKRRIEGQALEPLAMALMSCAWDGAARSNARASKADRTVMGLSVRLGDGRRDVSWC